MLSNADGQACINNPSVNQEGELYINVGRQVIVPKAAFNCNGRIKNIAVSSIWWSWSGNLPLLQVWRLTPLTPNTYNKTAEIQLPAGDYNTRTNRVFASVSLNSNNKIEFQSGDVIGYYQPSNPRRLIWSIETSGYTSYSTYVSHLLTSVDISNVDITNNSQPLIEVMIGKATYT